MSVDPEDWDGYLAAFHADRAGITETIFTAATDDGGATPYAWLRDAAPRDDGGTVLDLACGSAPL